MLFPGRVYDPSLGRFLQADPFVQDPGDPQSLNRYSYVRNNPLNFVDPSGYRRSWFRRLVAAVVAVFVAVVVTLALGGPENPVALGTGIAAGAATYAVINGSEKANTSSSSTPGVDASSPRGPPSPSPAAAPAPLGRAATFLSPVRYTDAEIAALDAPLEPIGLLEDPVLNALFFSAPMLRGLAWASRTGGFVLGMGEAGAARIAANRIAGQAGETFLKETYGGVQQAYKSTSLGARYIDNLAEGIARESKVGRTALTKALRVQIAKDVELMSTRLSGVKTVIYHFFTGRTGIGPTNTNALNKVTY